MQQPEWISGNIFIRPHVLEKNDVIAGHSHNFDHTSIVFTGSVRVIATLQNGERIERVFESPSHFLVRAGVEHRIESLEDHTQFWCVYSHREPQGRITQVYTGWEKAVT